MLYFSRIILPGRKEPGRACSDYQLMRKSPRSLRGDFQHIRPSKTFTIFRKNANRTQAIIGHNLECQNKSESEGRLYGGRINVRRFLFCCAEYTE